MYIVGISSGAFGPAALEEKPRLLGLYKKAQRCITEGVVFVQLDLESIAELDEPELEKKMKKDIIEKLGISFGIHSETKAFGVEAAELDSANRTEYERAHKRLLYIIKKAGEIGSKYLLIHSSESDPFPLLALRTQPADLVDFYGRPLGKFLEENKWLLDWLVDKEGKFMWVEIIRISLDEHFYTLREEWESEIRRYYQTVHKRAPTEEELKKELEEREKKEKERLKRYFLYVVSSRTLHYGPERWAYYLVAKWMEKNSPLWKKIVKNNITFFAKREKKTIEEWAKEKNIDLEKLTIDDKNFRECQEIWVPAVAAQYIWGHMNPKPPFEDPKKLLKKYKMPLVLESPMGGRGIEEWLRFYNPIHILPLIEEVGPEYMQLALDLEHMLSLRLDPELIAELLPEGAGKWIKVIHAGWPSTLAPAHVPIPLGSQQQFYLYKVYYKLRKKGFGLDPKSEHFILFERGPFPIKESILALRKIVEFLEKDVPPEKLPLEFFGIGPKEIFAEERQLAIIRAHAFEPLKGLLAIPEEEHGIFGRAAIEKGVPPEKWKKEELR